MESDLQWMEDVVNRTYPGLQLFVRDLNLGRLEELYTIGTVLRERGFTDASARIGGMVTTHRMAILSNHMRDLSEYEYGTDWQLFVANRGSRFKVLDVYRVGARTQIALLHLPEEGWEFFIGSETSIDRELVMEVRKRFDAQVSAQPIPQLVTAEWIERCALPIGMSEEGERFTLTEPEDHWTSLSTKTTLQ